MAPVEALPRPEGAHFERLRSPNSLREDDNEELLPEELAGAADELGEERLGPAAQFPGRRAFRQ